MGLSDLFRNFPQRVIISGKPQAALQALAASLRSLKLKDIKISKVEQLDGQWRCVINCMLAETLYYQIVLPLLYDLAEAQQFEIVLDFSDDNTLVGNCPSEILVSFALNSRLPYGDAGEHAFIQKIRGELLENVANVPAAVVYYIVGGGTVTICIPCADAEALKKDIQHRLDNFGIKKSMINVAARQQAHE